MRTLRWISILAVAGLATEVQAATPPQIGTAAVTTNGVTGALGNSQRTLKRGDGVFQNESIATGKGAGAQLLFRDETALTMGPESRVILDKLIYDPDKKTGEMTIRAVSGAFRFVTGSGPKAGYKIETPVGTIGVRGSIFQIWIREVGPVTQVILQVDEGGAYICGATKCVDVGVGMYVVQRGNNQPGNSQSKYGKECGAGGGPHCYVNEGGDTLYIDFLGRRVFDVITPAAAPPPPPPGNNPPPPPGNNPPPPPGNNPPPPPGNGPPPPVNNPPPPPVNNPPPTPTQSFSPIINPGVGLPPGLDRGGALPPGLSDRCTANSCSAPGGPKSTSHGPPSVPPGQLKKP